MVSRFIGHRRGRGSMQLASSPGSGNGAKPRLQTECTVNMLGEAVLARPPHRLNMGEYRIELFHHMTYYDVIE